MESTSLEMEGFPHFPRALFARTECAKVFGRLGDDIGKELQHNRLLLAISNLDVQKDPRILRVRSFTQGNLRQSGTMLLAIQVGETNDNETKETNKGSAL